MPRLYYTALMLILSLVSCSDIDKTKNNETTENSQFSRFEHDNYRIEYPSNWELDRHDTTSTRFILFAPDMDTVQGIRHNINMVTQDLSTLPMTSGEFLRFSVQQLKSLLKDSKVITSEMLKIRNDSVGHLIHGVTANGIPLRFDQFFWVRKNKAYLLSLTSSEEWFKKNQRLAENIMKSFEIRND